MACTATPIMPQQHKNTMSNAKSSDGENMDEIQSLTLRVRDLSQSVDWWNTSIIWAMVFAALAGIAVIVTTRIAFELSKQLGDTQAELIRAKDVRLTLDLADKEEKIGDATSKAEAANERAGRFEKEAQTLRADNLRLEAVIQPRTINIAQQQAMADRIRRFAGTNVSVRSYSGDPEGWRLGQQILAVLKAAQMNVRDNTSNLMIFGGRIGIGIIVSGPSSHQEFIALLIESLSSDGGLDDVSSNPTPSAENTMTEIMIGAKPFTTIRTGE